MERASRERAPCPYSSADRKRFAPIPRWMRPWVCFWTLVTGMLALVWFLLRTGTRPSRFAYPCQQAAVSTATLALGAPAAVALVASRRRLVAILRTAGGKVIAGGSIALGSAWLAVAAFEQDVKIAIMSPPPGYRPDVFLVNETRGVEPGRFGGVDDLISLMGTNGLKWHRSATTGAISGPDGLIDFDDVVIIKVNGQWSDRGGTNTDVLRGVIRQIVEHPDGFVGEVIVADNGQGSGSLDRASNNAEDITQSCNDVALDFAGEGWNVSTLLWDSLRNTSVGEYSAGSMASGYVVNPVLDPETGIRVSYAKFQSVSGTYISYKYGVWSPGSATYDADKLVVVNIPVFKTHVIYGVTASVKNHMGVVTRSLSTDSHYGVGRGGLGSVMAEVRMPDLTILDCIWILARPGTGPSASYASASRRDQLVASRDPVALDAWATKYIMMPQIIANGYSSDSYYATQDPDNPDSVFRNYLDLSMNELLLAGINATNDYESVTLHVRTGEPPVCIPSSAPMVELIGAETSTKNRFLSFFAGDAGLIQAVRVTFETLAVPFDIWDGAELWVGPPTEVSENGASVKPISGYANFSAAMLRCDPFYTDWTVLGIVHVFHEGIVPRGDYRIEVIDIGCADLTDPGAYSPPLRLTTSTWGDTLKDLTVTPPDPPDGGVTIQDVFGIITRLRSEADAIHKSRADLEPGCLDLTINISDAVSALGGFQGLPYAFEPSAPDPCDSLCVPPWIGN